MTITATELRARVHSLGELVGGQIEAAADEIRGRSDDPAIRRAALLWKMEGVPTVYRAAFRPSPVAAAVDLWALTEQMLQYPVLSRAEWGKASSGSTRTSPWRPASG